MEKIYEDLFRNFEAEMLQAHYEEWLREQKVSKKHEEVDDLFDKLTESLSPEQLDLFSRWSDASLKFDGEWNFKSYEFGMMDSMEIRNFMEKS